MLPAPVDVPVLEHFAGCKSWVPLDEPVALDGSTLVLDDATHAQRVATIAQRLTTRNASRSSSHRKLRQTACSSASSSASKPGSSPCGGFARCQSTELRNASRGSVSREAEHRAPPCGGCASRCCAMAPVHPEVVGQLVVRDADELGVGARRVEDHLRPIRLRGCVRTLAEVEDLARGCVRLERETHAARHVADVALRR